MPDGGLFVMAGPPDPFPCPPAPYERVSLIADYFKQYKPRSNCSTPRIRLPGRIYSRMPIVGYTAGPSIASAWGLRRSSSPRRSDTAEPDANVSDRSPALEGPMHKCHWHRRLIQRVDPPPLHQSTRSSKGIGGRLARRS